MKKILFTIIIFMFMAGFVSAKDPEYEVTIQIVYNSIPVSDIGDLVRDQLRKHRDACKVEINIKNPKDTLIGVDGSGSFLIWNGSATTSEWSDSGDTASD